MAVSFLAFLLTNYVSHFGLWLTDTIPKCLIFYIFTFTYTLSVTAAGEYLNQKPRVKAVSSVEHGEEPWTFKRRNPLKSDRSKASLWSTSLSETDIRFSMNS